MPPPRGRRAYAYKQTLKLAKDPGTMALRAKIQEWTDSLTEESGATTERIQQEIKDTLRILEKTGVGSTISNITTYIAIPIGLAAIVSGLAAAVGWICTIGGTIGLATSQVAKRKYQWASFGSSNKG
jgi:hypothetical protein